MELCKKGCSWSQQVSRDERNVAEFHTNKPLIEHWKIKREEPTEEQSND
jgi:hypothetical protein